MQRPEATLTILPGEDGTFVVETSHSAYLIDTDARTAERWPAHPGAPALQGDGTPLMYREIHCVIGDDLTIVYAPTNEKPTGFQRSATQVESITRAWPKGWPFGD
uniref:Uncharacterized protein n=1 Tax=uncultured organism TaxID=155900 RepID=A0A7L9QBT3_9ZZZZ|nr:hypothetical protein [uncultured organism]